MISIELCTNSKIGFYVGFLKMDFIVLFMVCNIHSLIQFIDYQFLN